MHNHKLKNWKERKYVSNYGTICKEFIQIDTIKFQLVNKGWVINTVLGI